MLVTDFDGTLRNSGGYVSPGNIRALKDFSESGGEVVIATARPWYALEKYLVFLDFIRYVILCNGAYILDRSSGRVWHRKPIAFRVIRYIFNHFWNSQDLTFMLVGIRKTLVNRIIKDDPLNSYLKLLRATIVSPSLLIQKNKIYNIEVSGNEKSLQNLSRVLREKFSSSVFSCFSWTDFIEIHSQSTSKGLALDQVRRKTGIKKEEVISFGDSENDIGMFRHSGLSVAMENASLPVRQAADDQTLHYDQDGVGDYIRSRVLVRTSGGKS